MSDDKNPFLTVVQGSSPKKEPRGKKKADEISDDPRPIIDYVGGLDLQLHSAEAWQHLLAKNEPPVLYAHSRSIARIDRDQESAKAYIVTCGPRELAHQLAHVARFRGPRGQESWQWTAPPSALSNNLLVTPVKPLPPLRRLTQVPVFTHDGRLIDQAGYDKNSGIYYDPCDLVIAPVADFPSEAEVNAARTLLLKPLVEFPFVDRTADCATCLALMIERFARECIRGGTPIYLFDSAKQGSGKGLCARVCLFPALGGVTNRPPVEDEEEAAKRLLAVLREGDELYLIDNQNALLDSASLAGALTTPYDSFYGGRLLGVTQLGTYPVRFSTVVTGNNARLSDELGRRTLGHVRIVVQQEFPEDRQFQCNLNEWLPANRAAMIHAVLTLIQNWIARGRPAWSGTPIGSFEEWCKVVGGILEAANIPGFMTEYKARRDTHNDRAAAEREFVKAWFQTHGGGEMLARDLVVLALDIEQFNLARYIVANDPAATSTKQAAALGRWLRKQVGSVFDQFQIRSAMRHGGGTYYRLVPAKTL